MLILEGPDRVGKTTLAKQLLSRLPRHIYAHFTALPWQFDYYWGYVERASRFIVQDRFHMSELAYAKAAGREVKLHYETYRLIDAYLRSLGAYTVLITADRDLIGERWTPDEMFSLDATLEAGRVYEVIHHQHHEVNADFDFTFHATKEEPYVSQAAFERILDEYRERQAAVDRIVDRYRGTLRGRPC